MQTEAGTPLSDSAQGPAARRGGRRYLGLALLVALCVYVLDQVTKWWAQGHLRPGEPRHLVDGLLELDLTHNAGAAFSMATGYTVVLSLLALLVAVVCVRVARRLGSASWAVALGLLLGGAVGNLTDRIARSPGPFRGHVVDFLRLPHWPVFNAADASICVAAALFVWLSFRGVRLDGSRDRDSRSAGTP
jgi:signal peptidase II